MNWDVCLLVYFWDVEPRAGVSRTTWLVAADQNDWAGTSSAVQSGASEVLHVWRLVYCHDQAFWLTTLIRIYGNCVQKLQNSPSMERIIKTKIGLVFFFVFFKKKKKSYCKSNSQSSVTSHAWMKNWKKNTYLLGWLAKQNFSECQEETGHLC